MPKILTLNIVDKMRSDIWQEKLSKLCVITDKLNNKIWFKIVIIIQLIIPGNEHLMGSDESVSNSSCGGFRNKLRRVFRLNCLPSIGHLSRSEEANVSIKQERQKI